MQITTSDIAEKVGGELEGKRDQAITGIAGIREAQAGDITFVANAKYAADVAATQASAVIVSKKWDKPCPAAIIRVDDPDKAFAAIASTFAPPPISHEPGVHPSAVIAEDVELPESVHVGPFVVIGSGAVIGVSTVLESHVTIGAHAKVGSHCHFYPHASLREYVVVGDRVIIHNGSVVGSDGFGYIVNREGVRSKIPQTGTVVLGDDVELGVNVAIDRARFGKTRIGNGVKIDNLVQIAHNVIIGDHAVIVAQVGIAGSSEVGQKAILAGQAGVAGHLTIGEGAIVGAQAGVTKNVEPGAYVIGFPATPHDQASKLNAHVRRLPELKKRIAELEARVDKLDS